MEAVAGRAPQSCYSEGNLDHLVEGRLIAVGAERAIVRLLVHRPELLVDIEHPAAFRTQDVPGQLEQPEPRRMEKGADCCLLVEAALLRKTQDVDTAQIPVFALMDQGLNRSYNLGSGRIAQRVEQCFCVVHAAEPMRKLTAAQGWCGQKRANACEVRSDTDNDPEGSMKLHAKPSLPCSNELLFAAVQSFGLDRSLELGAATRVVAISSVIAGARP